MMGNVRQRDLAWLAVELLCNCLDTRDFRVAQDFLQSLDGFGRKEILRYLLWEALRHSEWWLAEACIQEERRCPVVSSVWENPLHQTIVDLGDRPDVIAWFIDKGATIEERSFTYSNSTPLICAAQHCCVDVMRLLLAHGAEVNANTRVDDELTALMAAATAGCVKGAKLLLDHGADLSVTDRWGNDAAFIATQSGYPELAHFLKNGQEKSSIR